MQRTLQHYKDWVSRLATREYADELVITTVATHLKVRIVVVPWTPPTAQMPWKLSSYPDTGEELPTVHLGNNDVHYMWMMPQ